MFVKAIEKASKAMFPIFRVEKNSTGGGSIAVVGTGFFISPDGKFATVAHVFDGATNQTEFQFRGWLPDKAHNPTLVITEIRKDGTNDLFIGQIKVASPDYLELADELPPVGRSVCVAGYPLYSLTVAPTGQLEASGVRRYFQPSFVLDHALIPTPDGSRKRDGFLVRDIGLAGMSGGPIFDVEGLVLGIQAATLTRENVIGARKVSVDNGHAVKSSLAKSLLGS